MTAQIADRLIFEGRKTALLAHPLMEYFDRGGIDPGFQPTCTALWRGYIANWEIVADRLYLVELQGLLQSGEPARLESVFPGFPERVFAHWFSGILRIPQGRQSECLNMGAGSLQERHLLLNLRRGVVVGRQLRIHEQDTDFAPDGDGAGGRLECPHSRQGARQ